LQKPETHGPLQQSASVPQVPPMGVQVRPDGTQVPFWHAPPEQQSESDVHVPVLRGMHDAAHFSAPVESGTQTLLQQLSHRLHEWPAG
jgi:hypothetical protein